MNANTSHSAPIYVAASSKERERYRAFLEQIPAELVVTHVWADAFDAADASPSTPTRGELSAAGARCFAGVKSAAIVIFLVPTTESRGFWVELGIAIDQADAGEKFAVITAGNIETLDCWQGFTRHAHFDEELEALEMLEAIACDVRQLGDTDAVQAAKTEQMTKAIVAAFNDDKGGE